MDGFRTKKAWEGMVLQITLHVGSTLLGALSVFIIETINYVPEIVDTRIVQIFGTGIPDPCETRAFLQ